MPDKCAACGSDQPRTSSFCSFCGARLPWASPVQSLHSPSEQERLAARVNADMDALNTAKIRVATGLKEYVNSPQVKKEVAETAGLFVKLNVFLLGCFGVGALLLIIFIIVAMTIK